jgi:hypothetical protein
MNNKAQITGEGIFLFWRLLLIAMLVLFVSLTVGVAFSSKQDVRSLEASMLADKIVSCISSKGITSIGFSLDPCLVADEETYVGVNITSFDGKLSILREKGNPAMKVYYKLSVPDENQKYPAFLNQKSYTLISNQTNLQRGTMEVLVGIKKYGSNI